MNVWQGVGTCALLSMEEDLPDEIMPFEQSHLV